MKRAALVTSLCLLASAASAAEEGEWSVGVGVALALDLPDKVSKDYAKFGPGPSLQVPVRWQLAPLARLRGTLRIDYGSGDDRLSWEREVDGEVVTLQSAPEWAGFLATGLTLGADVFAPLDAPVDLYAGAEVGVAWVDTFHSLGGSTQELLDPEQNNLDSPSNIDPFTAQATFLSDIHLGAEYALSDGLALWGETGYSIAFLNARPLKKTPEEYSAMRDPYGWNAWRIGLGIAFAL